MAPKNGWLEYFPIGEAYFQVRAVRFREGSFLGNENHPSNSNNFLVAELWGKESIDFLSWHLCLGGTLTQSFGLTSLDVFQHVKLSSQIANAVWNVGAKIWGTVIPNSI